MMTYQHSRVEVAPVTLRSRLVTVPARINNAGAVELGYSCPCCHIRGELIRAGVFGPAGPSRRMTVVPLRPTKLDGGRAGFHPCRIVAAPGARPFPYAER